MKTSIQKVAVMVGIGGLAIALLGVVLIQFGPRDFEAVFSGVHRGGIAVLFVGLAMFLLASVLGRHAARLKRMTGGFIKPPANWRSFWLRATLGSAVSASFCAIWLWPLGRVFPQSPFLAPFYFGHWLSLAAFVVAGVGYVVSSAIQTLAIPPTFQATIMHTPALPSESPFANPGSGPSDARPG